MLPVAFPCAEAFGGGGHDGGHGGGPACGRVRQGVSVCGVEQRVGEAGDVEEVVPQL
jgi:hypothetical protein